MVTEKPLGQDTPFAISAAVRVTAEPESDSTTNSGVVRAARVGTQTSPALNLLDYQQRAAEAVKEKP